MYRESPLPWLLCREYALKSQVLLLKISNEKVRFTVKENNNTLLFIVNLSSQWSKDK
jgi:hypothetical protein